MIKEEGKISGKENKLPWSSVLHDVVTIVSIWKHTLSQFKSGICHHSQREYQTKSLETPINTHWINIGDIKRYLINANRNLKIIRSKVTDLRTQHLLQRASAMNLEIKNHSSKTTINIQKLKE